MGKITVIGDSISYGSVMADRSKAFPLVLSNYIRYDCKNYSIGGSTIAKKESDYAEAFASLSDFQKATKDTSKKYLVRDTYGTDETRWWHLYEYSNSTWKAVSSTASYDNARTPIVDRITEIDSDADIIIICAGTNDFYYNWTEFGNASSLNKTTFCGAFAYICKSLAEQFPKSKIYACTQLKRVQYTGQSKGTWDYTELSQKNTYGKTLQDYNDAIQTISATYGVEVIDFYNIPEGNPYEHPNFFADTDSRLVHPKSFLHKIMAMQAYRKIKETGGIDMSVSTINATRLSEEFDLSEVWAFDSDNFQAGDAASMGVYDLRWGYLVRVRAFAKAEIKNKTRVTIGTLSLPEAFLPVSASGWNKSNSTPITLNCASTGVITAYFPNTTTIAANQAIYGTIVIPKGTV